MFPTTILRSAVARSRFGVLLVTAAIIFALALCALQAQAPPAPATEDLLKNLEEVSGARLGVYALETSSGRQIHYRADERFPVCSTFKVFLASAILQQSVKDADLLSRRVHYAQTDLVAYSPDCEDHVEDGMTMAELCAAALEDSDNTAANLLMKTLGGPSAVTAFAHANGSSEFRLDRWETELNTAVPGDARDTATPAAMAHGLQTLMLGDGLPGPQREQLKEWLLGNNTGAKRIRAAVPATWQVGDKTGSGDYGTANDLAVLWPPGEQPILLAIYQTHRQAAAKRDDELIVAAARIVLQEFASAARNPTGPDPSKEAP